MLFTSRRCGIPTTRLFGNFKFEAATIIISTEIHVRIHLLHLQSIIDLVWLIEGEALTTYSSQSDAPESARSRMLGSTLGYVPQDCGTVETRVSRTRRRDSPDMCRLVEVKQDMCLPIV